MLTKPFKPLALAFLVNLIISVEDKIKYKYKNKSDLLKVRNCLNVAFHMCRVKYMSCSVF